MNADPVIANALRAFRAAFGTEPEAWVQAPGRVNLIGEHTDYNDGFVLPCAIDRRTVVAWRRRADGQVRVVAADQGDAQDRFDTAVAGVLAHAEGTPWADYVRGMAQALREAGHTLPGLDLAVAGDVPQGAGLSSSASLEVAVGEAFRQAGHGALATLDPSTLALLAQRAENQFVGCQCGIMDQLIAARGEAGHALLIDCRSLAARSVPLPAGAALLIVHSQVRRGLVDSEYNLRRAQCEAAARHYRVPKLRDLDAAQLLAGRAGLDQVCWRRARHIVSENQRTLDAADALAAGDLRRMGELMAASHDSMRDDFEITVPAIDQLALLLQQVIGPQGGARMTGGGFGGCVVALLPEALVDEASAAVQRHYRSPEGLPGRLFRCRAAAGAGPLAVA